MIGTCSRYGGETRPSKASAFAPKIDSKYLDSLGFDDAATYVT